MRGREPVADAAVLQPPEVQDNGSEQRDVIEAHKSNSLDAERVAAKDAQF